MVTEHWTTIGGRRVRWIEAGTGGTTVVLVPGLGLSARFYRDNVAALALRGFRALAPDPPGFGRSQAISPTGLGMAQAANWLVRFCDAVDLPSAAWVGHSVSCQALVELAAAHPARVEALVLAAPSGAGMPWLRAPGQVLLLAAAAFVEPPSLIMTLAGDYLRTSPLQYTGTWLRAAGHDPLRPAALVRCPTLLLGGARDPIARRRHLERLATTIPRARIARIGRGSHGLPYDAARSFNRLVATFVDLEHSPIRRLPSA